VKMRLLPQLAALLLGAAAAYLVACGNGDNLIPASDASRVQNALDEVASDFRAGRCQDAEAAVAKARGALLNLPSSVDSGLRDRLQAGLDKLAQEVPATCGQSQAQTQDTQTTDTNGQTTSTPTTDTNGQTTSTPTTDTNGQTTSTPTTDTNGQTTSTPTTDTNGQTTSTPTTGDTTGGTPGEG
jgi:hypothetical protein